MKTAVYGGSFNPPHIGHALVAGWALWSGAAEEVWLVPTFAHPFGKPLAPFSLRLELCGALARTVSPHVGVCAIESELPPPSYTVDTLDALASRHPTREFRLLLGADLLPDLPRWKDFERIRAEYEPIIVGRQGYAGPEGVVDFPGISSTEIRRMLAAGEAVDHLVPREVVARLGDAYSSPDGTTAGG